MGVPGYLECQETLMVPIAIHLQLFWKSLTHFFLTPPCVHSAGRLRAQGHAEAQEMPKIDFGMAV